MMLVVIVGAAAILVTKLSGNSGRSISAATTQVAMATARNALLDYATSYPDLVPGESIQLPCPDIDAGGATLDGEAHRLNCGAPGETVIGRFPWKSLGIPAQRDGAGECLWYVVSGEYKSAATAKSEMINPDSNGQLQLFQSESGSLIEGATPSTRAVAMIFAPQKALSGQIRQSVTQPGQQCSDDFSAASFLDSDAGTGISNAVVTPGVGIDQFIRSIGAEGTTNDHVVTIRRDELADLAYGRHDFETRMRSATESIAKCIAAYGASNPGGPDDRRLPWPAPTSLADYRVDTQYDDVTGGVLSGRLADVTDDSNGSTGNSLIRVLSDCPAAAVPEWNAETLDLWKNWKDHFFYYVAESFDPVSPVPNICTNCISINAAGQYAAVILFANRRLQGTGQVRNAPPVDTDTKFRVLNYLEGSNESSHPYTTGPVNLESRTADATFNDILYCIDPSLSVSAC
jgi:type II secretory pathway pseudopilin PulG